MNPNKKPRLDIEDNNWNVDTNEELWDQDDMTAEEFDMLETQATQSHSRNIRFELSSLLPNAEPGFSIGANFQHDEKKQKLYELEGKIKILTSSLEKITEELKEERIHKDKVVSEKMKEFNLKESAMQKEIEKLQSILQFKEHEVKTVYNKINLSEKQEKAKTNCATASTSNRSPNKFMKRQSFVTKTPARYTGENTSDSNVLPVIKENTSFQRKYKLSIDAQPGKLKGANVVSLLLCNRLNASSFQDAGAASTLHTFKGETPVTLSALSVAKLNSDQKAEQLWQYYANILSNHVAFLKIIAKKSSEKSWSSSLTLLQKDIDAKQVLVISNLKDLMYVLSCHPPSDVPIKFSSRIRQEAETQEHPIRLFSDEEDAPPVNSLLDSLLILANPDTYPPGYPKDEEVARSLSALTTWSSSHPERFICCVNELPLASLLCGQNIMHLHLSLRLLLSLVVCQEFKTLLTHKSGACLLCAIGSLCRTRLSTSPMENTRVILMVEDFLSTAITTHYGPESKFQSSPCSSEILQGFITALWKYANKNSVQKCMVLQKGLVLLHTLSSHVLDFKEKRMAVEDCYVSLISSILSLCKEQAEYIEFQDILHDLWDFQDDACEFDLDEVMDSSPHAIL